jgi:hypothetical protein
LATTTTLGISQLLVAHLNIEHKDEHTAGYQQTTYDQAGN